MIETTRQPLIEHLQALELRDGTDLVVHSRLIAFGRIAGGAETVYDAIRCVVGASATLVFPTYTFDGSRPYDPATSPSTNVGVLGEHVRLLTGAVRSRSPIHNHVAIGPRAEIIAATPPAVSLGPDSDFQRLHDAGFTLLLLGCRFSEGCTYLHHLEAVVGVPYRRWIELDRQLGDAAVIVRYYARTDERVQERFDVVVDPLERSGALRRAPAPYGESFVAPLREIDRVGRMCLADDPYGLVTAVQEAGV